MQNAAIVGLGWWGQHIIRQLRDSNAITISLAVGSREEHRSVADLYHIAFTTDLTEALTDPSINIIILATPHKQHVGQIVAAAEAGKHVFCEKPLALTVADARIAIDACRLAKVHLGIGHERRFEPAMDELRSLLKNRTLGEIMHIEANFSHDKLRMLPSNNWRIEEKDDPPLTMTATGIHLTDIFLDLLGPIKEVAAFSTNRIAFASSGDILSAHLRFQSGATGYINTVLVTPFYSRIALYGSDAWVEVQYSTHPDQPGNCSLTLQCNGDARITRNLRWRNTVLANLEQFSASIEGHTTYPFSNKRLIDNIAVLEAITQSVASSQSVAVLDVQ